MSECIEDIYNFVRLSDRIATAGQPMVYLYRQMYDRIDETTARLDLEKIWIPNQIWQTLLDRIRTSS
jgi:hypothetical protein